MFDLGFSEVIVIAVLALVVLGPERLPRAARAAGRWLGKIQTWLTSIKQEVNTYSQIQNLQQIKTDLQTSAQEIQHEIKSTLDSTINDIPAWEKLPSLRTPEDFHIPSSTSPISPPPTRSLRQQSMQRRRQNRPKPTTSRHTPHRRKRNIGSG